jgi:hypothetical protein
MKPEEAKIAQLFLLSNSPEKIAELLDLDIVIVNKTLELPQIIAFIKDIQIEDLAKDCKLMQNR